MDPFLRFGFSANLWRRDHLTELMQAMQPAGKNLEVLARGVRNTTADATGWIASRTSSLVVSESVMA
jgi:hypothetical protein